MMKSLLVAAIAIGGAACATTGHQPAMVAGQTCRDIPDETISEVYNPARIRYAAPIYKLRFVARAIQSREVLGAELYIDATSGVSQAYLERVLSCHVAGTSKAHPNDPLRVRTIQDVDVRTHGPYFIVSVQGTDRSAGREIWAKAQALMTNE
jgi:hypothetical protein